MTDYLDVERWPRRGIFELFRRYDNPYFNVCVPLDVTALLAHTRAHRQSFSIACVYLALRTANEYEPFRYRLEGDRVRIHGRIHGGMTTLRDDDSIAFIYFEYDADFRRVHAEAIRAREAARATPVGRLDTQDHRTDLVHFSSLPWIEFTGLSHARNWSGEDSVPKITFGRYHGSERVRMPISVEVHHALMDGLHVGRFLERLQERCAAPALELGTDDRSGPQ